jgi:hypothetical protein
VVAMSLGPAGVKPPVGLVPAEAELTATKGAIWCGSGKSWPRRRKASRRACLGGGGINGNQGSDLAW